MYIYDKLQVRPVLAEVPLEMPIDVLLALPKYVTSDPQAPRFNLPGVINRWLGGFGWQRATKIMNPRIWAPGLSPGQLQTLITERFLETSRPPLGVSAESLCVLEFPGLGHLANADSTRHPQYEIVHFIGHVRKRDGNPMIGLESSEGAEMGAGALRDALVASRTRLLILHVPLLQFDDAVRLAEFVVGGGGPSVLTVIGGEAEKISPNMAEHLATLQQFRWGTDLERYFSFLYLNLIHNLPLSEAATPDPQAELKETEITARLLYGEDGDIALQFDRWMDKLDARLEKAREQTRRLNNTIGNLRNRAGRILHQSQVDAIASRTVSAEREINNLVLGINKRTEQLREIRRDIRNSESEGAGPLLGVAETIPEIEVTMATRHQQLFEELEKALIEEALRAPRVLNANFLDPSKPGEVLSPNKGLFPNSECGLLIDIGPAWDKMQSIVKGAAQFPTHALRQDVDGWEIQVVLVSDDFLPHTSTAIMWVPRAGGRSFPYHNGQRAAEPGPVVFHLRVPPFRTDCSGDSFMVRGRLCSYYENNLLQSAVVKAGVVRTPDIILTEVNEVEIDFVLTGSFHQVDRFAKRSLQFSPQDQQREQPIALSLTLNDDGADAHRIIFKGRLDPSPTGSGVIGASPAPPSAEPTLLPGWTHYDPEAAAKALELARTELRNCFFVRGAKGEVNQQTPVLNEKNGKKRDQFKLDLQTFALLGNTLFRMVTSEIKAEGNGAKAREWTKQIKRALKQAAIIQVARTGRANYVFPWALIYDTPMPGPKFDFCPIIDEEWDERGIRKPPPAPATCCPHQDEESHLENVICPYGFWGLKHIIEQPLSKLCERNGAYVFGEADNEIRTGAKINLSLCLTRAFKDVDPLNKHLDKVKQMPGVIAVKPDATDVDMVRSVLQSPSIVYFVCHGEYDPAAKLPYLGVGLQNNEPQYRIADANGICGHSLRPPREEAIKRLCNQLG